MPKLCPLLLFAAPAAAAPQSVALLQMDKVLPTGTTQAFSGASNGVAFDGETLAVGYHSQDSLELFELDASGWNHVQTITAPDPAATGFPGCFDLHGDVLACGARGGGTGDRVFVWRRVNGTWTYEQELLTGDPSTSHSGYGYAHPTWGFASVQHERVKVHGDRVVVTAPDLPSGPPHNTDGSGFVFEYANGQWSLVQRLGTPDNAEEDIFGTCMDFDGERIIIGDPRGGDASNLVLGRAHVFDEIGGVWTETAILEPTAPHPTQGRMAAAVAIDGDVVAMGTDELVSRVEVYEEVGGTWQYRRRLAPSGGALYFGIDLEIEGSLIFVGAPSRQGSFPEAEGRVYIYSDDANQWNEAAKAEAFDGFNGQAFGLNIAVTDRRFVASAPNAFGGHLGAAYGAQYCPLVGTPYCIANPNSSGFAAQICVGGSPVRADEDLVLFANYVPQSSFGYFLMSEGQDFVPNFAGSQGNLCIGGTSAIYRFSLFVLQSPGLGTVRLDFPWTGLPAGAQLLAGDTWNFQYWFRDANPTVTSNTSDAIAVTFQ